MSVQRRVNWISQQRVDLDDLRSIESAGSNDFDQLFQGFVTGTSQGYIVRGFNILMAGAIGGAASSLSMVVDPGCVVHIDASQSGTILQVPTGTSNQVLNAAINSNVSGAFTPNAVNYVTIDYIRFLDDTTSSQVYLWDPTSNTETVTNAPRANILTFVLNISTATPTPNLLPIATVITDSGNNVVDIQDDRWLFNRLATGGLAPNPFYSYPWSQGRNENPSISSSSSIDPFQGGDKNIGSQKELLNALMSIIKEIKGTTYWYSPGNAGSIEKLREDVANTITTGQGVVEHSATTAGLINWDENIYIKVIGTQLSYLLTANPSSTDITLADGQTAYITLDRDVAISPNLFYTYNSIPNTTTVVSIGSIAWTSPLMAGDYLRSAADTDAQYTPIQSVDSSIQVTLTGNYVPVGQTASGVPSIYTLGTYNAVATPSGPRDIYIAARGSVPVSQNTFWLFAREDNSGVVPRVYVHFLGQELEQGESTDIDDGVPRQLLTYIGSPMLSASKPQYVSAIDPGSVPEIQEILTGSGTGTPNNSYFLINSSNNTRLYYVWFNKDGAGVDPMPANVNSSIEVTITSAMTAAQVAGALTTALNSTTYSDFTAVQQTSPTNEIIVTNNSAGTCNAGSDFNVGSPFSITQLQAGTGIGNNFINDGDNLTLAIKKLDEAIGSFISAIDEPSYDEPYSVASPISSGSTITIPLNTRLGSIQQQYTVGKGYLQLFLNGQYLLLGSDWNELGTSGEPSSTIQILENLVIGDVLHFRMTGIGGGGSGGGSEGPPGPQGPSGPPGHDAAGGPVAISTKNTNYTVSLGDNALLADCSSGNITFSLPSASSAIGYIFYFKKIDSTANAMILLAAGADTIDGLSSQTTTTQYESFTLLSNGSAWYFF